MQYYYECLDIYEKLIPEVKNHCITLQRLEKQYHLIKNAMVQAAEEVQAEASKLTAGEIESNVEVVKESTEVLSNIASEKCDVARSLIITVDYYLSRLYGYVREFSCEADCETPGTSAETDKKQRNRLKLNLRNLNHLREEYSILDELMSLPPIDSTELSESTATANFETLDVPDHFKDVKLNGHRQNIVQTYQSIVSSFMDEDAPPRARASTTSSLKRQGQLRIKTERRGSLAGSPSPRSVSPRTSKFKMEHNFFQPSPSYSGAASPMETSPMPSSNTFNYESPMPLFISSQESRHGRQRKFTPKAQQMFKEHKLQRPVHYGGSHSNFAGTSGLSTSHSYTGGPPSAGIASTSQGLPSVASASYSFPQDFNRLPTPNQHHHVGQVRPSVSTPTAATPYVSHQRPMNVSMNNSSGAVGSTLLSGAGPTMSQSSTPVAVSQQQQQRSQPQRPQQVPQQSQAFGNVHVSAVGQPVRLQQAAAFSTNVVTPQAQSAHKTTHFGHCATNHARK